MSSNFFFGTALSNQVLPSMTKLSELRDALRRQNEELVRDTARMSAVLREEMDASEEGAGKM